MTMPRSESETMEDAPRNIEEGRKRETNMWKVTYQEGL
jgi:hypothetical protein